MLRSFGARFLIVGLLVLAMVIPMFYVGFVIEARRDYSRDAAREVSNQWGGAQTLVGPVLVVPVMGTVERVREVTTDDAVPVGERFRKEIVTAPKPPLLILPQKLDAQISTDLKERHRGIFKVPVYSAQAEMEFHFDFSQDFDALLHEDETLQWDRARISLHVSANRALRGAAELRSGDRVFALEPNSDSPGISALVGNPRDVGSYTLDLGFNGAQRLFVTPFGRDTQVVMKSNWPHPSFSGAFLPDESEISESGFEARWHIPHLARSFGQLSRGNPQSLANTSAFGTKFYQPNDFYQRAFRAARYAVLFVALTFLTVLLLDRRERPAHPVQYLLIGLAQTVFVVLMVAYAEQVGFGLSYLGSSAATIGLITLFGFVGLKMGKRALVLGALLVVLYAVLYLILQSTDYALLAGATLAFGAVAGTMILTRNEEWYGPERKPSAGAAGAEPEKSPPE